MKKIRLRSILKIICIIIIVLVLLGILVYIFINPFRGSITTWKQQNISINQSFTREEAVEDLSYMLEQYKSVDYSFKSGAPNAFIEQYDEELTNLSESPTMLEIWQAASRIIHTLQIGHDGVCSWVKEDAYYNTSFRIDNDTLLIDIEGNTYEVASINGISSNIILENASQMLSYENDIYKDFTILSNLQSLSGVSLLTGKYSADYIVTYLDHGVRKDKKVELYQSTESETDPSDFVSYKIDSVNNVAIFNLNKCHYNKHYKKVLKDFFTEVKEQSITNIALDLRNNGGGSSLVANEFVKYLNVDKIDGYTSYFRLKIIHGKGPFHTLSGNKKKALIYNGNIYVLTSAQTFSSAMNFSVLLQDNKLAKVIGEPCGNKPSQYGETVTFIMPNSKLYFICSIGYFARPDKALTDEPYQTPDYLTEPELADEKLYELVRAGSNN